MEQISLDGIKDKFTIDTSLSRIILPTARAYEAATRKKFVEVISELDEFTFLDLGAHFGYFSFICANMAKNSTIYSFDANEKNLEILNINMSPYPNCHVFNAAIYGDEEEHTFIELPGAVNPDSAIFEMRDPIGKKIYGKGGPERMLKTRLLTSFGIDFSKVKVIKMDTQGCEESIVRNIFDLLEPDTIMCLEMAGDPWLRIAKDLNLRHITGTDLNIWAAKNG